MFHSLRHTVSTTLSLVILATTAGLASAQSAPAPTAMRSQISIPQNWQINPYDHPPTPADLATLSAMNPSSQVTSMPRARVMAQRETMTITQPNRVNIPQNWQINPYDHPPTPADLQSAGTQLNLVARANNRAGNFQAAEHPTQGGVKVVTQNGQQYLEFDKSFKTDNGPDLHVILYRNAAVPVGGLKANDYVSLAKLQKVQGAQRYLIPNTLNSADFKAVAVWCQQFNATFGFAPLQANRMSSNDSPVIAINNNGERPREDRFDGWSTDSYFHVR